MLQMCVFFVVEKRIFSLPPTKQVVYLPSISSDWLVLPISHTHQLSSSSTMGCTASKLDNEDTVRRCKERRRFMKEAVYARHNLAAAHNDYFRSLRLTGSALLDFASGEALSISDQTPAILLRNPSSLSSSSFRTNPVPPPAPKQSREQQHPRSVPAFAPSPQPPPPPPSYYSPSPSSPTIASSKLPHILSESSLSSTPKHHNPYNFKSNTTYASTPSQDSSSVWNWENFYPPSPPDSDFFERKADDLHSYHHSEQHHHESDFFERKGNDQHSEHHSEHHHQQKHHHLHRDEEDIETEEREEVQCSDWGDQYSTTSSDTTDDEHNDGGLDRESRSEIGSRSNFGSSVHEETMTTKTKSNLNFRPNSVGRSEKSDDAGSSFTWNRGGGGGGGGGGSVHDSASDMRMVVRHRDLVEIAAAIKEYFDQAASAGNSVSDLLELGRAQLDRSFRQLKKHVYHSNSVLSTISSGWTSKPPLAIKYRLDAGSLDELGDSKSHCSTLERLLAWEKKLYEEVKTRVGVNIELEKKLSSLQNQEYKGEDEAKLDKTKASIKRLQSLIVVTSQAASTTSSAILHVRDTELAPQLVELCHGFMYMWRSMNQFHEVQNEIVQQVRGLVNRAAKGSSTSDLHRQATKHLESAVSAWHSSFCLLIKYQRSYVRSLHGWFKLTLLHVNNSDNTDGVKDLSAQSSSLAFFSFLDEWKQALDRLPDTVASEAIKSFVNVVHVISDKQSEEMKIKRRSETASKELDKKASSLRNIEKKFYHSYSMVGVGLPDGGGPDGRDVFDARDPLSEKKLDLAGCKRRVEDEMARHLQAVEVTRAMTLNNIQTGLPGVFQAMAGFSRLFTEALEGVCTRSYSIT